jgi:hypothetical protein
MRRVTVGLRSSVGLLLAASLLSTGYALAHSAVCTCFDNGDKTVTCEGGFSDGSSAAGVSIRVFDAHDKVLAEGKMDGKGSFTFKKPEMDYHVIFDAGQGHVVTIDGGDITE